jgi:integrase
MPSSRRTIGRLSTARVRAAGIGLHADGGGLLLQVTAAAGGKAKRRSWLFRYTLASKQRYMGLGTTAVAAGQGGVSLAEARAAAEKARALLRVGIDPIAARDEERVRVKAEAEARAKVTAGPVTFAQCFDEFFEDKRKKLTGARTAKLLQASMRRHVLPLIGDQAIETITGPDIVTVLKALWHTKPVTASILLQNLSATFDAAIFDRHRTSANPCIDVRKRLGRQSKATHHRSMDFTDVPSFLTKLRSLDGVWLAARLALEWMTLTACRGAEARAARWAEIDERSATWHIPAMHMKRRTRHDIPMSSRCLEILDELRRVYSSEPEDYLFPGVNSGAGLSHNTLGTLLAVIGVAEATTPHGLRASFRTWAADVDKCRDVVGEAALGHGINDRTTEAYLRTSYLAERRPLMERWALFCVEPRPTDTAVPNRQGVLA